MSDFQAKHMIESLRSGIPSRAVGAYFSEARPDILRRISSRMQTVRESGHSDGMIFTGRYGEGKTHLLNTVFHMATTSNLVVSYVAVGKETPFNNLSLLYQKVIAGTYLPGEVQPGFESKLENMTPGSGAAGEMLSYAATQLDSDKLYFLFKAYLETKDEEEKTAFLWDLEGDLASISLIKRSYRKVTGNPAKLARPFKKTQHMMDYFRFMSHLFVTLGYDGWVILFDEVELLGRLGKAARLNSYVRMYPFLQPTGQLEKVMSLFALSASYSEDVIDKRKEADSISVRFAEDQDAYTAACHVINAILKAPELVPLSKSEVLEILTRLQAFHGEAYDWTPAVSAETLYRAAEGGGYLLRTRIRAAIEFLDQLYQYGSVGKTRIDAVGREILEEDTTPRLEGSDM